MEKTVDLINMEKDLNDMSFFVAMNLIDKLVKMKNNLGRESNG